MLRHFLFVGERHVFDCYRVHVDAAEADDATTRVEDDLNSNHAGLAALLLRQLRIVVDLRDPARESRSTMGLRNPTAEWRGQSSRRLQPVFAISFSRTAPDISDGLPGISAPRVAE